MKEKEIVCGPDNVKAFNAQLRQLFPDFYPDIKTLHAHGLIDGIRGAKITFIDTEDRGGDENAAKPEPTAKFCHDCSHWLADKVGNGTGVGKCLQNVRPTQLKWPKTPACDEFMQTGNDNG